MLASAKASLGEGERSRIGVKTLDERAATSRHLHPKDCLALSSILAGSDILAKAHRASHITATVVVETQGKNGLRQRMLTASGLVSRTHGRSLATCHTLTAKTRRNVRFWRIKMPWGADAGAWVTRCSTNCSMLSRRRRWLLSPSHCHRRGGVRNACWRSRLARPRACLDIPRIKSLFSALTQERLKKLKAWNAEEDDNDECDANNQARQFLTCCAVSCCAVSMLRVLRG